MQKKFLAVFYNHIVKILLIYLQQINFSKNMTSLSSSDIILIQKAVLDAKKILQQKRDKNQIIFNKICSILDEIRSLMNQNFLVDQQETIFPRNQQQKTQQKVQHLEETLNSYQILQKQLLEQKYVDQRKRKKNYDEYEVKLKKKIWQMNKLLNFSYTEINKIYNIPINNVLRWCKNGYRRRQGSGRKVHSYRLQNKLEKWIKDNYEKNDTIYYKDIRNEALKQNNSKFKASKGWLYNFIKRKNLNLLYKIRKI